MKQYFAYGAFTVCLTNAIIRPDLFSVILVGITCVMALTAFTHATTRFEDDVNDKLRKFEAQSKNEQNKIESVEIFLSKRLEETLRRLETLESQKEQVTKDLAETKRVVRDINLANTFVPRAKRGGTEL